MATSGRQTRRLVLHPWPALSVKSWVMTQSKLGCDAPILPTRRQSGVSDPAWRSTTQGQAIWPQRPVASGRPPGSRQLKAGMRGGTGRPCRLPWTSAPPLHFLRLGSGQCGLTAAHPDTAAYLAPTHERARWADQASDRPLTPAAPRRSSAAPCRPLATGAGSDLANCAHIKNILPHGTLASGTTGIYNKNLARARGLGKLRPAGRRGAV